MNLIKIKIIFIRNYISLSPLSQLSQYENDNNNSKVIATSIIVL